MNKKEGWIQRLKAGLRQSSDRLRTPLVNLLKKSKLTPEVLEQMEEIFLQADLGVSLATELTEKLAKQRFDPEKGPEEILNFLAGEVEARLLPFEKPLVPDLQKKPWVCLLVGVNGSGKTTTAGKLAAQWRREGFSVRLVAGDTFRAAATQQLEVWAERAGVPLHKAETGCDSAGLVFSAFQEAEKQKEDILLVDTAGRLQNKGPLMEELSKMVRVLQKKDPSAPHSCILVLEASVGQNALNQVALFQKAAPLSGLIVTKLDGTAKGGIVLDLTHRFPFPLQAIGVGETIEDLQSFRASHFASALFRDGSSL
jgi:fused signal recognition particle receptor